jgi:hypothetical protein
MGANNLPNYSNALFCQARLITALPQSKEADLAVDSSGEIL